MKHTTLAIATLVLAHSTPRIVQAACDDDCADETKKCAPEDCTGPARNKMLVRLEAYANQVKPLAERVLDDGRTVRTIEYEDDYIDVLMPVSSDASENELGEIIAWYPPTELIVEARESKNSFVAKRLLDIEGLVRVRLGENLWLYTAPKPIAPATFVARQRAAAKDGVLVVRNERFLVQEAVEPPPAAASACGSYPCHLEMMRVKEARNELSKTKVVDIAVIDTAVAKLDDYEYEIARSEIDCLDKSCEPRNYTDGDDHGTGVVSLLVGKNVGVARGFAKVVPVRVRNSGTTIDTKNLLRGVDYVGQEKIPIAVMPFLGRLEIYNNKSMPTAARLVHKRIKKYADVTLFVTAAGNTAVKVDCAANLHRPGSFFAKNILNVAGSTPQFKRTPCTAHSKKYVHTAAPGSCVCYLSRAGKYMVSAGTSWAAPLAAGLGALVRQRTSPTPNGLRTILVESSRKRECFKTYVASAGVVDAVCAIKGTATKRRRCAKK
ncbi:MAG: S8/S53 family peptidase [Deltaproteobacteria bacterium]